jgi:hypothetical protein
VLSLRTAQIRIDEIKASGEAFVVDDFNTRCRFALRFGDIRDDNNKALVRADSVRRRLQLALSAIRTGIDLNRTGRVGFSYLVPRGRALELAI